MEESNIEKALATTGSMSSTHTATPICHAYNATAHTSLIASSLSFLQKFEALENLLGENQDIKYFTPLTFSMEPTQVYKTVLETIRQIESNQENLFDMNNIETECEAPEPMKLRRNRLFQLSNKEQWGSKSGLERFFGYSYLDHIINKYNLETLRVAPKKVFKPNANQKKDINITVRESQNGFRTIDSRDYFIFSKYIPNKLDDSALTDKEKEEIKFIKSKGFSDLFGYVNLRRGTDGLIYIIDTEYASFNFKDNLLTVEQRNLYVQAHQEIPELFQDELKFKMTADYQLITSSLDFSNRFK